MHFQTEDGLRRCVSKASKAMPNSSVFPLKVVFLTGDHIAALHWMSVAMNKVTESQSCGERAVMAEHFCAKSNSQCLH